MKRYEGIYGFIASDPELTYNADNKPRLYVRIGINRFEPLPGGRRRRLPPTFHDLVQFERGAELTHDRFKKGDDFVAVGYVRSYTRTVDGKSKKDEQFVAYRLSHDGISTDYEVIRRPRTAKRDLAEPGAELHNQHAPAAPRQSQPQPSPAPPSTDDLTR
ncbi:single-stranded DNA-binding protein [Jiangella alba]|uniref:Single-stranded DNA-binding protein n=1 Tax=Jiangella alba TaxID=561176 RepID=A0A1H5MZQ7_9ACTN|nr:single-stranded DNA-binding protein [Jiangella alba]SEE94670.1 Single-stranded DNA-binding protein [Jiangella alba]